MEGGSTKQFGKRPSLLNTYWSERASHGIIFVTIKNFAERPQTSANLPSTLSTTSTSPTSAGEGLVPIDRQLIFDLAPRFVPSARMPGRPGIGEEEREPAKMDLDSLLEAA
jgi:hypothetical protein